MSRLAELPDIVLDAKLETVVLDDQTTEHVRYQEGSPSRERRLRKHERWKRSRVLGQGAFGVVYLENCTGDIASKTTVRAVKEIKKYVVVGQELDYWRELEAIFKFSHRNYSHCFVIADGWYEKDDAICIVMEYMEMGDLQTQLASTPLSESSGVAIAGQILEGLSFMHKNNFVHRDLKPGNIMVKFPAPNWWVKIADFGLSKRRHADVTTLHTMHRGTIGYAAPEILGLQDEGASYSFSVDLWSLGAVIYKILTLQAAFPDLMSLFRYASGGTKFPMQALESMKLSKASCDFISQLMSPDPESRPSATSALQHEWLRMFDSAERSLAHTLRQMHVSQDFKDGSSEAEATNSSQISTLSRLAVDASPEKATPLQTVYAQPYLESSPEDDQVDDGLKLPSDSRTILKTAFPQDIQQQVEELRSHIMADGGDDSDESREQTITRPMHDDLTLVDTAQPHQISTKFALQAGEKDIELECGHVRSLSWVRAVFKQSITDPLEMPPRCCNARSIPFSLIERCALPSDFPLQFRLKLAEYTRQRVPCPAPSCRAHIFLSPASCERRSGNKITVYCLECKTLVCCDCKEVYHDTPCRPDPGTRMLLSRMETETSERITQSETKDTGDHLDPEGFDPHGYDQYDYPSYLEEAGVDEISETWQESIDDDDGNHSDAPYHEMKDAADFRGESEAILKGRRCVLTDSSAPYCHHCWGVVKIDLAQLDCDHMICARCLAGLRILGLFSPQYYYQYCCNKEIKPEHYEQVRLPSKLYSLWLHQKRLVNLVEQHASPLKCPNGHSVDHIWVVGNATTVWDPKVVCGQCVKTKDAFCIRCQDEWCGVNCSDFCFIEAQIMQLSRLEYSVLGGWPWLETKLKQCLEMERDERLDRHMSLFQEPQKVMAQSASEHLLTCKSNRSINDFKYIVKMECALDYLARSGAKVSAIRNIA